MKSLKIFCVGVVAVASHPLMAWDFGETEDRCTVSQVFEGAGSTLFLFTQDQANFDDGDQVMIVVQNDNWTTGQAELLGVIRFATDQGWFENDAVGMDFGEYPGAVVTKVSFNHLETALSGFPEWLHISRADKTIDRLSLAGLSSYYYRFKKCREKKLEVVRERERKESLERSIPRDPFSG